MTWYKIKMISSENLLERRSAYNFEKLLIKYQKKMDKTRKKGLKIDGIRPNKVKRVAK
jgi:hypothetical protein